MSQIAYDPVKDKFAGIIRNSKFLRRCFYFILDVFFLRSWHVRRSVRKLLRKHKPDSQNWKILDAGCGFGQYDRFLLKIFPEATIKAVDVKEDYLADCVSYFEEPIKAGKITFEKQDLLEYVSPDHDLILCVDVLEHIEDDVQVMVNMWHSLKPGGYFVMHSPSHLAEDDAGDDEFFVDEHARAGYSRPDLGEKFRLAGFEPVQIKYTYGRFGHFAWMLNIKWPMLMLNKIGFWSVVFLPFWYALTILPSLLMKKIDLHTGNPTGTGILGIARRPVE
jgi:SAM-dependent methyltransferase